MVQWSDSQGLCKVNALAWAVVFQVQLRDSDAWVPLQESSQTVIVAFGSMQRSSREKESRKSTALV